MTRLAPAGGVAVIDDGFTVYAAQLPSGPITVLEGVAALIWTEACAGDLEGLSARVTSAIEPPVDGIDDHVDAFISTLLHRGLLRVMTT